VPDAVKGITARELGGHMKFLASDGRAPTAIPTLRFADSICDLIKKATAHARPAASPSFGSRARKRGCSAASGSLTTSPCRSGIHADYHRPTDDFTKADFEKAARVARAAYRLGWQVAQDKEAPKKIKAAETKTAESR